MENSVEGKPCINRESDSLELTISYTYVMMNMNILAVVTPPSIYHGCSTWKKLWGESFTAENSPSVNFYSPVKLSPHNVFQVDQP